MLPQFLCAHQYREFFSDGLRGSGKDIPSSIGRVSSCQDFRALFSTLFSERDEFRRQRHF